MIEMKGNVLRFFIIGPQKTGSTWLRGCLRQHPDICMPSRVNETFFFDRYFARGLDWYANYFVRCEHAKAIGEVAPTYFAGRDVGSRIQRTFPDARLVVSLRNPIDRAWSMYRYLLQKGDTRLSFRQAVVEFPGILEDGLYANHLNNYLEFFSEHQILNLIYEDTAKHPEASLTQLFQFLEVDDISLPQAAAQRLNEGKTARSYYLTRFLHQMARVLHRQQMHEIVNVAKRMGLKRLALSRGTRMNMDDKDRIWCADYFREDMAELSVLLHRDFETFWLGPPNDQH